MKWHRTLVVEIRTYISLIGLVLEIFSCLYLDYIITMSSFENSTTHI